MNKDEVVTKVNTQKQGRFSNPNDYQVGLGKGIEERTQAVLNVLSVFPKENMESQPL